MRRCIYVIRSSAGPVKVGVARRPGHRLAQLRTSSPVPLALSFSAETGSDVVALERRAHELLHPHRLSGEWFATGDDCAVGAVIQAALELGADLRTPSLAPAARPKIRRGTMLHGSAASFVERFGDAIPASTRDLLAELGEATDLRGGVFVVLDDVGDFYVPIRPLVAGMGLDWTAQFRRVGRDPILSEAVRMMPAASSPAGDKESVCLPLGLVPGFLFGSDASRVAHAVRPRIIAYQRRCFRRLGANP